MTRYLMAALAAVLIGAIALVFLSGRSADSVPNDQRARR